MENAVSNPVEKYVVFDRVREQTAARVNDRIDLLTQAQAQRALSLGPEAVERRIAELDREWDIDRALMLNFALVGGSTFAAGISGKKRWLYFFMSQLFFMGYHATKGWCPPAWVMRRMNFRTRNEIEAEKHALLLALPERSRETSKLRRAN